MKYGYVLNIEDTPSDNVWTEGREITLKDNSVVYGVEGVDLIGAVIIGNAQEFNQWLEINRKEDENPL